MLDIWWFKAALTETIEAPSAENDSIAAAFLNVADLGGLGRICAKRNNVSDTATAECCNLPERSVFVARNEEKTWLRPAISAFFGGD